VQRSTGQFGVARAQGKGIPRPRRATERAKTWLGSVFSNRIAYLGGRVTPFLIVGLGGFLGANLRFLVGGWAADRFGIAFPLGTLLINVTGCFVIGFFLTLATERLIAPPSLRLFFVTGFLGAYTTFSTFAFESVALMETRALVFAAANLVGSVLLGIAAVILGIIIARVI